MTQAVKNVKPRKKSVRRIKTDDGRYVVALVDEDGLVIAANEFISAKDTQSVCNMVWAVLVRCCGEEPPEDSNITNFKPSMSFKDFAEAITGKTVCFEVTE